MLFCYEIYKLLIRLHSNLKKIFFFISEKRLLSLTLQHSPQAIFFHFLDFFASINNWISFFVTFLILTAAGQSHNIWISVECFCLEIRFIYTSLQVQSYQPYLKNLQTSPSFLCYLRNHQRLSECLPFNWQKTPVYWIIFSLKSLKGGTEESMAAWKFPS